jgi:hypothetical protein
MMRWISPMVAAMVTAGLWAQEEKVQDPARSKELNTEADEKQAASFWPVYASNCIPSLITSWRFACTSSRSSSTRLCQEFHGRCAGRRTGATGDGAGRAANGIAKEIIPSHEAGAAILPTGQSGAAAN